MKKQQRRVRSLLNIITIPIIDREQELELKLGEHLDELLAANELLSEENARLTAELEVERARSKRWEDM